MKIKSLVILLAVIFFSNIACAHIIDHGNEVLRHWNIEGENKFVDGSFYMLKNNEVYIEDANDNVLHFPITSLSKEDKEYALTKSKWVEDLNKQMAAQQLKPIVVESMFGFKFWITLFIIVFLGLYIYFFVEKKKLKYILPIFFVGIISVFYSFSKKSNGHQLMSTTNPLFIDSAFAPFRPAVNTFWNSTYFYVESHGIPSHKMMVGISNHGWQQQVPIPQCYIGTNAWPIPLNPVISSTPIPVDSIHFTRGAIALAANGVPIFNVHTNTGVDSYLDGQLDNVGGHCGRGDDYHYHIAPTHLYSVTSTTLPCAFALDGFAVYGSVEPNGSPMGTLDANHGHFGTNGVYHYHGTAAAPYMIAKMAGQVTEDTTHQLVPQAVAHPVRPAYTPLNGALITDCIPNTTNNGYKLIYTLSGQTDSIVYSWTLAGVYTFKYYTASLTTTNYNGFTPCTITTSTKDLTSEDKSILIYPNPTSESFSIKLVGDINTKVIKNIAIYSLQGALVYNAEYTKQNIDIKSIASGTYIVKIQLSDSQLTKKLIVK